MYFVIDFLVFVLLVLIALAIVAGAIYLIYRVGRVFTEKRNRKIMEELYLPMIKEEKIREFIKEYEAEGMRVLTLAYLCFRGKEGGNELEEILADLGESIPYAVESGTPEYVESLLHTLGDRGLHVRFNSKKEFQYSMKY